MKYFSNYLLGFLAIFSLFFFPIFVDASNESALFAGGCFWCLEHDFEDIKGVVSVESGYSGGDLIDPTYQNHEGHKEVIRVTYDPLATSYKDLLSNYWINIDPFDGEGQFCDRGDSYRPVIYTQGESQIHSARESLRIISNKLSKPLSSIKVEIKEANRFWLAEKYHQDFARKNKFKYKFYRYSCGRDQRLDEVWNSKN